MNGNFENVSERELQRQVDEFSESLWSKGFDGVFYSHHKLDGMNYPYSTQGTIRHVLGGNIRYERLCGKLDALFPLMIRTWWNNQNKGQVACHFRIDYSPSKGFDVPFMQIERNGTDGRVILEKTVPLKSVRDIPDKEAAVALVTVPRNVKKGKGLSGKWRRGL